MNDTPTEPDYVIEGSFEAACRDLTEDVLDLKAEVLRPFVIFAPMVRKLDNRTRWRDDPAIRVVDLDEERPR